MQRFQIALKKLAFVIFIGRNIATKTTSSISEHNLRNEVRMPGPLLRNPNLKDPGPLRSGLYDEAYAKMRNEADDVAAEEFNIALLNTTRIPLPDPVMPTFLTETTLPGIERNPVEGTPVFGSDEEFARVKQEASTLADTTPLGQFTQYRPGFKADTTLKTAPSATQATEFLTSANDWETAFPSYKVKADPAKPVAAASARMKPSVFTGVRSNSPKVDEVKHRYREAIASIESRGSGDYSAIGPTDTSLGRALGRYQVMEANVGPWTKEVLGRELTPKQFLSSPKAQDLVFDHIFGKYVEKFGSTEKAAQAWFAGSGGVGTTRKDVLGTSVSEYGRKFTEALK